MRKRLAGLLADISSASVTVVGDAMLDEYIIGDSSRISPEAPEPIIEERERQYVPGGAANVAVNVTSLGAKSQLFTVIGDDSDGAIFRRKLVDTGVNDIGLINDLTRVTTRKTRLIARGNQVLRVDHETTEEINATSEKALLDSLKGVAENVIVVSDYAKGVVTSTLVKNLSDSGKKVIADPKSDDFAKYSGAYVVTPNYNEFCIAVGKTDLHIDNIESESRALMEQHGIANMLVTLGADGMMLVEGDGPASHIHTRAREVYDVTGAGDTVVATLAAAVASGASLIDACNVANIAAGIVVGKRRTARVTPNEIMVYAFGVSTTDKIVDIDTLKERIGDLRYSGNKVVFTNGCFDLLHIGHITYLNKARSLGDLLVIGLNTDDSIRRLKGNNRPIINQDERCHVMAALECVDFVVLFDDDTPVNLIKAVLPDVLVKGADYTREQVVGHDIVEANGGSVALIPIVNNTSTSDIIRRIKKLEE